MTTTAYPPTHYVAIARTQGGPALAALDALVATWPEMAAQMDHPMSGPGTHALIELEGPKVDLMKIWRSLASGQMAPSLGATLRSLPPVGRRALVAMITAYARALDAEREAE